MQNDGKKTTSTTSSTPVTSGTFRRELPKLYADNVIGVTPLEEPQGLYFALRKVYSKTEDYDKEWADFRKERHMQEIKEAGKDYEI